MCGSPEAFKVNLHHPAPRILPGRLCQYDVAISTSSSVTPFAALLRQVMSYGMVLCASDDAHGSVEPVAVPEGVPLGERIQFEGYTGMPGCALCAQTQGLRQRPKQLALQPVCCASRCTCSTHTTSVT